MLDTAPAANPNANRVAQMTPGVHSVLALRDLRIALVGQIRDQASSLRRILELDPPTVLRLLRMAHAPVNAVSVPIDSLEQLISTFGRIVVRRALEVEVIDATDTDYVRQLWLHSVATGQAARSIAGESGELDPEIAYLRGLLFQASDWCALLEQQPTDPTPAEWLDGVTHVAECGPDHECGAACRTEANAVGLLERARRLAELAGFCHPEGGDPDQERQRLGSATREDLVAAHQLRTKVWDSLAEFNLQAATRAPAITPAEPTDEELRLFGWTRQKSSLADVVTSLQSCSSAYRYRSVITVMTAAALRYLDYERAFLAVWSPELKCCWIRAKSDMSPRPLVPLRIVPSEDELSALEASLHAAAPRRIARNGSVARHADGSPGLLVALGVDEVVCVPVNPGFATPSILLLDRTLTRRPLIEGDDLKAVTALAGTASMVTENLHLKKLGQRATRFALTDPLTRLFNRAVGISTLEREISRSRRTEGPLTVLMLDMDEFKLINDQFGHLRGDQALRCTAAVLTKTLRKQDTVCRYGGEEFMVVLPDTTLEQASVTATRIFTAVEDAGIGVGLPLTVSIGLTQVDFENDSVESVLARADRALYASKSRGRNRFSVDGV